MRRWVVDTNVAIVANGPDPNDPRPPSVACRLAAVEFLLGAVRVGQIMVDAYGEIAEEYHRYLNPRGQPGVGDRFYLHVLQSDPQRIVRIHLPRRHDEEYADLPQSLIDAGFDPSDRKFAALAKKAGGTVANAIDSDWLNHRKLLANEKIAVHHVCSAKRSRWFVTVGRRT